MAEQHDARARVRQLADQLPQPAGGRVVKGRLQVEPIVHHAQCIHDRAGGIHSAPCIAGYNDIRLDAVGRETSPHLLDVALTAFLQRSAVVVEDGRQAIPAFKHELPNLVILDLIMPKMGGRECLQEMMKVSPRLKVIIASGFAMNGEIEMALEEGAKASVMKPYQVIELIELVRTVLDEPREPVA